MLTAFVFFFITTSAPSITLDDTEVVVPESEVTRPAAPVENDGSVVIPKNGEEINFIVASVKWIGLKWKSKEYGPAFAATLMLLLAVANVLMIRLGKEIRKEWMPTVSIATGVGVSLAMYLRGLPAGASAGDWILAVFQGATVGMAAVGAWEWIGKKLFNNLIKKQKDAAAKKAGA